jgi:anti-sigma regulatory factor (Ser/Thr protein kinase)
VTGFPQSVVALDERVDTGRVEEADRGKIENDVAIAVIAYARRERGSGGHVDLARDGDRDLRGIDGTQVEGQLSHRPHFLRAYPTVTSAGTIGPPSRGERLYVMGGDKVEESVTTQLPSGESTSSLARAFLRNTLETWELDGLGEVTELLTSELVTNVVRHVGTPMTVRAVRHPSSIRVEVDDASVDPPVLQHPAPLDAGGRGLLLVDTLADQWGTDLRPDGKTVWFEIDAPTATGEMHDND